MTGTGWQHEVAALTPLAAHLTRYNRSLAAYAKPLVEPGTGDDVTGP